MFPFKYAFWVDTTFSRNSTSKFPKKNWNTEEWRMTNIAFLSSINGTRCLLFRPPFPDFPGEIPDFPTESRFLGWPTISFACSPCSLIMECQVLWLNSQFSGYNGRPKKVFLPPHRHDGILKCFCHDFRVSTPTFPWVCASTPFFFASQKTAFPGISRSTSNRWTEGSGILTGGKVYVILLGNRIVTVGDCKVIGSQTTEAHLILFISLHSRLSHGWVSTNSPVGPVLRSAPSSE